MATKAPDIDITKILGKRGFGAEVTRLQKADQARRDKDAKKILGTDTIRDMDVDAAKLLMTTLGGVARNITLEDLRTFSQNAVKLGRRFVGGITARGVIDASLKEDQTRANEQIRTAIVVKAQAGTLSFVTNAGPDSKDVRHHVNVEFPSFKAYAASPKDSKLLAKAMLDGPLKFECTCGRFTFWYRFLATKGGFAAGRLETGFPRVRNPNLSGVSCKHGLRVMQSVLKDANVRIKAANMIAAAQKNDTKAQTLTAAEAKAEALKQLEQSHHKKNLVETSAERAARLKPAPGTQKAIAAKKRAVAAAAKTAARKAAAAEKTRKEIDQAISKLQSAPMTKAQRDAIIAKLMATQTTD